MPSNTLDGLRTEFAVAVAVITPQMDGFQAILSDPTLTEPTQQAMQADLDAHKRRNRLLFDAQRLQDAFENAIAALVNDGYPNAVVEVDLSADIRAELEAQRAAYSAAFGEIGIGTVDGSTSATIASATSALKISGEQLQTSVDANTVTQPPTA